mgnify:CR=1 FL=1
MMAAYAAAKRGQTVRLYEKNEKLGKKIFITGKGRCNLTNGCEVEDLFTNVVTNEKFLYSAFYGLTNRDVMELFEEWGCRLKVERGNRVFPVSDKSSDVIAAIAGAIRKAGVEIHLNEEVSSLELRGGRCVGVRMKGQKRPVEADAVIVATGGFGGSEELMTKYNGGYFKLLGLEQNVGEGLLMMTAVGAQEYHVGGACAHQTEVPVQVSGFSVEDTAIPYTITNLPVLMRLSKTASASWMKMRR